MPTGIVSNEDFEKELKGRVVNSPIKGRGNGSKQVPESLRKIIGETSEVEGRKEALALARMFGVSESSTSAYAQGATSTASYNNPTVSLTNHITTAKERISLKARNRLLLALGGITEDKLKAARVRDVSGVARDMAAIIKDMEPDKTAILNEGGPTFIVYAPQIRREDQFDVIDLQAEVE